MGGMKTTLIIIVPAFAAVLVILAVATRRQALEQDVGLYFKRLRVLQGLFGDADHHNARFQQTPVFTDVA